MALKENYKDDILDTSQNVKRKYQMENNGDGTVSFTDVTEYTQQGDSFGSGDINPIAHAINGLNNYNFHPSGSIDLVAYIADDSYYLNEDNKYVLADSTTGQALINSDPSTYKALASNTDLYGIEGEDTVSGFEPSCTPIVKGGVVLSTIDDKLNYLVEGAPNPYKEIVVSTSTYDGTWRRNYTEIEFDDNTIFARNTGGIHNRDTEYLNINLSTSGSTSTYSIKVIKPCYVTYKRTTSNNSTEVEISARNYAVNEYIRNETVSDSIDFFTLLVEEPRT